MIFAHLCPWGQVTHSPIRMLDPYPPLFAGNASGFHWDSRASRLVGAYEKPGQVASVASPLSSGVVGARMVSCNLAMVTPQTFTMAS